MPRLVDVDENTHTCTTIPRFRKVLTSLYRSHLQDHTEPVTSIEMAAQRLTSVLSHIIPGKSSRAQLLEQNPDDIVITLAIRTPLTKARKGGFKDTTLDGLVFKLLQQVVAKMKFDPQLVEDISLGNVSHTTPLRSVD